jgi:hypothetical protein
MKMVTVILASILSISSVFAGSNQQSIEDTIREIELNHHVRCDLMRTSVAICLGPTRTATCHYSQNYSCHGAEKVMGIKLKIKDYFNLRTNTRKVVVTKVEF